MKTAEDAKDAEDHQGNAGSFDSRSFRCAQIALAQDDIRKRFVGVLGVSAVAVVLEQRELLVGLRDGVSTHAVAAVLAADAIFLPKFSEELRDALAV